jgi:hypothetical protein
LRTPGGRAGELELELKDAQLRIAKAGGPLALAHGQSFTRSDGAECN